MLTGTQYDTSGLGDKGGKKSCYGSIKRKCNIKAFQIMEAVALLVLSANVFQSENILPATCN